MSRFCIAFALLLVVFSPVFGQKIKGNGAIERGMPVHLTIEGDQDYDIVRWRVTWPLHFEKGKHYFENGKHFYTAIPCKGVDTIRVLVTVVNKDPFDFNQFDYSIEVRGPPVKPDPDPDPDPTEPPKETDFTKSPVYQPVLAAIKDLENKSNASDAAANFETVAKQVENGEVKTLMNVWLNVSRLNIDSLGDLRRYWQATGSVAQDEFKKLNVDDFKEYAFHLRAVAAAIREGVK